MKKGKWHCFHTNLSASIQFWAQNIPFIYSMEVCYIICCEDLATAAIDVLFNTCLLCLTTLQPQVSSQTHKHTSTHTHTKPRGMSVASAPDSVPKQGERKTLLLRATACQSTALKALAGIMVQLRDADNIHPGLPVDTFKECHFSRKTARALKAAWRMSAICLETEHYLLRRRPNLITLHLPYEMSEELMEVIRFDPSIWVSGSHCNYFGGTDGWRSGAKGFGCHFGQSGFIKTPNDDSHVGTENHHSQSVEAQGVPNFRPNEKKSRQIDLTLQCLGQFSGSLSIFNDLTNFYRGFHHGSSNWNLEQGLKRVSDTLQNQDRLLCRIWVVPVSWCLTPSSNNAISGGYVEEEAGWGGRSGPPSIYWPM